MQIAFEIRSDERQPPVRFNIPKGILRFGEHEFGGSIDRIRDDQVIQLRRTSPKIFADVLNALVNPKKTTPTDLFDTTANIMIFAAEIGDIVLQNVLLQQFWEGNNGRLYTPLRRGRYDRPTEEGDAVLVKDMIRTYERDDLQPLRRLLVGGLARDLSRKDSQYHNKTLLDLGRYYEVLEHCREESCLTRLRSDLDEQLKSVVQMNKARSSYDAHPRLDILDFLI